ncbi:HlyD family secretion protein [Asticcacaulis sp.]|uniref:HlyD family secretion protein n=1 Tax=Asticcacaulis sp. TaxID=1872648 RepID=UPI002CABC90A|nr:HlyD family efflux transporter periplasmic adaptor subunit [Asticcacaulis sp.]HTM79919.1 HlyD family efflux transporter periplasmic adaptor subunit [Asticcacaulis sp.]
MLQKDFEAASTLMEKQYISQVQLMQKRDALLQGRQALSQIDQSIAANHNQIEQLGATLRSSQSAGAEAEADLRLIQAQFDEKQISTHASDGAQVSATRAGEVTNIQVRVGEVVAGNQTMGLVVPDGIRSAQRAELWVPSRAVGFIRPGNTVRVMFDAFPYQTFGVGKGRVVDVSSAPLMPNELPIPLETKEQMYRVVVALDGDALTAYGRKRVLLPGMRLTADVVLDEKSFLDWLLDPLLAIRKRAGG